MSQPINITQVSRCLCGRIFIAVNSFKGNDPCFLNVLKPEAKERVASGPGISASGI